MMFELVERLQQFRRRPSSRRGGTCAPMRIQRSGDNREAEVVTVVFCRRSRSTSRENTYIPGFDERARWLTVSLREQRSGVERRCQLPVSRSASGFSSNPTNCRSRVEPEKHPCLAHRGGSRGSAATASASRYRHAHRASRRSPFDRDDHRQGSGNSRLRWCKWAGRLSDGVGGALIPLGPFRGLLGGQHLEQNRGKTDPCDTSARHGGGVTARTA